MGVTNPHEPEHFWRCCSPKDSAVLNDAQKLSPVMAALPLHVELTSIPGALDLELLLGQAAPDFGSDTGHFRTTSLPDCS